MPSPHHPSSFPQSYLSQEAAPASTQLPRTESPSSDQVPPPRRSFLWPQLFNSIYFSFISHLIITDLLSACVSGCSLPTFLDPVAEWKYPILYQCQSFLINYTKFKAIPIRILIRVILELQKLFLKFTGKQNMEELPRNFLNKTNEEGMAYSRY